MSKVIYIFDLYAQPFPLRFKKAKKYKSKVGLILGILSLMSFLFFIIRGFLTIFNRKSFSIVEETKYLAHPITNFTYIPFLLHLQHVDTGDDYTFNTSIFDISLTLQIYEYVNNEITYEAKNINLEKCDKEKFLKLYPDFYDYSLLHEYLCPDVNETIYLEGDFSDASKVQYLTLKIGVCNNNDKCLNYDDIYSIIDRIKLVYYVKINFPVYNDYIFPIKHYYKSFQISLSSSQTKDFSYYYLGKNFTSDNGLILEENHKYIVFDYNSVESEVTTFNNKYYLRGRFYADKKFIDIKRTYEKITVMLGEVGGTIGVIFRICNGIIAYLLRNAMNEDIINLVIDRNTQVQNEKMFRKYHSNSYNLEKNLKNKFKSLQKKINEETSKTAIIKINNLYNYSNNRFNSKYFTNSERIELEWYHHLLPMEYCSGSRAFKKLNKHKDFVFKSISLEKLFEIDLLQNAITKMSNRVGKIINNNTFHHTSTYKNYNFHSIDNDNMNSNNNNINTNENDHINTNKNFRSSENRENNNKDNITLSSITNLKRINISNRNISDISYNSNFHFNNNKEPILKKINYNL
jgi:hypothetical protein